MNDSSQCSSPDCEHPAISVIEQRSVCLTHFITTCNTRLEEISKNVKAWALDQTALESAGRFTKESSERATEISRVRSELTLAEQARLLEIVFWATQLGKELECAR